MGKHSKSNCASSAFTYAERRMLKYGTQKKRLGSDSMLEYDACALCLHRAENPQVCHDGHMFCKGCILESLLTQKQAQNEQLALWEQQTRQEAADAKSKTEQDAQARISELEKRQQSILPIDEDSQVNAIRVASQSDVPAGYEGVRTKSGILFKLKRSVEAFRNKEMPCYWIPDYTPDAGASKVKKPVDFTVCPQGAHPLRMKYLVPVKFTEVFEREKPKPQSSDPSEPPPVQAAVRSKFMCPHCRRNLTNSIKCDVVLVCGHVACHTCVERLVIPDMSCAECGRKCTKNQIVSLKTGGTFFAHSEGAIAKKKLTPAFQG